MTQLVVASTLFGASTAAAASDAGLLGDHDGERILLVVNNAAAPELSPALDEIPGADPVLRRFDRIVHLNDLIAPVHPSDWITGSRERPLIERLLRTYWGLDDSSVEIVCESIWVNPALNLSRIFHDARLTVYADGLMSYGPTRDRLPLDVTQRLQRLLHLDLVPGLRPVLLTEYGVTSTVIPSSAFRALLDELVAESAPAEPSGSSPALVIGQYLSALGLVSRAEETAMHVRMVRAASDAGADLVRFKPHPSAPPGLVSPLRDEARRHGVELEVVDDARPVEALLVATSHVAIVGCFSTALATARNVLDTPSICIDTGSLLERLEPFENSNRVPLTLIDAMHHEGGSFDDAEALQGLVTAVAYCMQPEALAALRPAAVATLRSIPDSERRRYFRPSRLTALGLPGGPNRHPVRAAAIVTTQKVLRHPALGWLDERTRTSATRQRLGRLIRG